MKKKTKGYMAGGKIKTKGYMAGGKIKTKGYAKGGVAKVDKKKGTFASSGAPIVKGTAARGSGAARKQIFRKNG